MRLQWKGRAIRLKVALLRVKCRFSDSRVVVGLGEAAQNQRHELVLVELAE